MGEEGFLSLRLEPGRYDSSCTLRIPHASQAVGSLSPTASLRSLLNSRVKYPQITVFQGHYRAFSIL